MKVLVTARLRDGKLATKLAGLLANPRVSEVILVRRDPLPGPTKLRNVNPAKPLWRVPGLFEIWRLAVLVRLCRRERPTTVCGIYLVLHGLAAALAGLVTGTPWVVSLIGDDVQKNLRQVALRPFLAWAVRGAAMVTVMGPRSKNIVTGLGCAPDRVVELQNVHDHLRFSPPPLGSPRYFDVVFVGDFIARKRVDILLRSVAGLSLQRPVRVALVGDGPLLKELSALAGILGIGGSVEFLGRRKDVEAVLRDSCVLALPTAMEGLPAAAVEAMLCGLPVVMTDVGDVAALFTHDQNALLTPPGDTHAFEAALDMLLSDPEHYNKLRQGALEAREGVIERWGASGQVRSWDHILDVASGACATKRDIA